MLKWFFKWTGPPFSSALTGLYIQHASFTQILFFLCQSAFYLTFTLREQLACRLEQPVIKPALPADKLYRSMLSWMLRPWEVWPGLQLWTLAAGSAVFTGTGERVETLCRQTLVVKVKGHSRKGSVHLRTCFFMSAWDFGCFRLTGSGRTGSGAFSFSASWWWWWVE